MSRARPDPWLELRNRYNYGAGRRKSAPELSFDVTPMETRLKTLCGTRRAVLVMASCVLFVSGCTGAASGLTPGQPSRTTLFIGLTTPISTLNPVTMASPDELNAAHFVWQGLLGVTAAGNLFPVLARSIPTHQNGLISRSGLTITFILRRGLKWSDGDPITARDVRFGWNVSIRRLGVLCQATCPFIKNITAVSPPPVKHVAAISSLKVRFTLTRPFPSVLYGLPPILPRHQMWKGNWTATFNYLYQKANYLSPNFAVDGPYEAESTTGNSVTLQRNPQWHIVQRPAYSHVTFVSFPTDTALMAAQETGAVQVSQGYFYLDFRRGILTPHALAGLHVMLSPAGIEHLEPNLLRSHNILADVNVRLALSLAIDRQQIVADALQIPFLPKSHLDGSQLIAFSPQTGGSFDGISVRGAWDPIKGRFVSQPEVADAGRLLRQAGWILRGCPRHCARYNPTHCPDPKLSCKLTLKMLVPHNDVPRAAEAKDLQVMWAKLGVELKYDDRNFSAGNLTASFAERGQCAHGWDNLCMFAQLPGVDPQTDYALEFTSNHIARHRKHPRPTDINFTGVQNPQLDRIFHRAPNFYNTHERARLYRQWQKIVVRRAVWISLFQRPYIVVERGTVQNLRPSARGAEWNPWALAPDRLSAP